MENNVYENNNNHHFLDNIRNETRKVIQLSHFWCFVCRQCKPRKNGVFCLSYFGNFLCEDCDKETKKPEFDPAKFHKDSESANPLCFSCGTDLPVGWARGLCLCDKCKLAMGILKVSTHNFKAEIIKKKFVASLF
ncbi:hypothetical protein TNCV_3619711 [Trichonephila clavipes]|nr:hypothetical protein TNCV_3619711 [Trichonephila clavipes]